MLRFLSSMCGPYDDVIEHHRRPRIHERYNSFGVFIVGLYLTNTCNDLKASPCSFDYVRMRRDQGLFARVSLFPFIMVEKHKYHLRFGNETHVEWLKRRMFYEVRDKFYKLRINQQQRRKMRLLEIEIITETSRKHRLAEIQRDWDRQA